MIDKNKTNQIIKRRENNKGVAIRNRYLILLTISLLGTFTITSCVNNEVEYEKYAVISTIDGSIPQFDINMSDSSLIYSLSLSARFAKRNQINPLNLEIILFSPSGERYCDSLQLPSNYKKIKGYLKDYKNSDNKILMSSSIDYYDVQWKYRDNIRPKEYGIWKMIVKPEDMDKIYEIGIHLKSKKKENERKRQTKKI